MIKLSPEQIRTVDISMLPQTRTPPPTDLKRDDIGALFKAFNVSTFLQGGNMRKTLPHIRSDEILFYAKPAQAVIAQKTAATR